MIGRCVVQIFKTPSLKPLLPLFFTAASSPNKTTSYTGYNIPPYNSSFTRRTSHQQSWRSNLSTPRSPSWPPSFRINPTTSSSSSLPMTPRPAPASSPWSTRRPPKPDQTSNSTRWRWALSPLPLRN